MSNTLTPNQEIKDKYFSYEQHFDELYNSNAISIHFDTRDFAFMLNTTSNPNLNLLYFPKRFNKFPNDYLYNNINEALDVIKELYTKSGGKGEWRYLSIPSISFLSNWYMKYISITKIGDKYSIIVESRIVHKVDIKQKIDTKNLHHH